MPHTVETEDGIIIENIPDDVSPDSPEVRARVAEERARRDAAGQPTRPSPAPAEAQPTPTQPQPAQSPGVLNTVKEGLGALQRGVADIPDALLPGQPVKGFLGTPQEGAFIGSDNPHAAAMDTMAEFLTGGVVGGGVTRGISKKVIETMGKVPKGELPSLTRRFFEFMGRSTVADDATTSLGAGIASTYAPDLSETRFNELQGFSDFTFTLAGSVIGGEAWKRVGGAWIRQATKLLDDATADSETFLGASKSLFTLLESGGLKAQLGSRMRVSGVIESFGTTNKLDYVQAPGYIEQIMKNVDSAARDDKLTVGILLKNAQDLKARFGDVKDSYGAMGLELAQTLEKEAMGLGIDPAAMAKVSAFMRSEGVSAEDALKTAQGLWQRGTTAKTIERMLENTVDQTGGVLNPADRQQILNKGLISLIDGTHPQSSFLKASQKADIKTVLNGKTPLETTLRAVSRLGINSEDWIKGRIMGAASAGAIAASAAAANGVDIQGTAMIGGGLFFGTVASSVLASNWAKSIMRSNTRMLRSITLAGNDPIKIANAYRAATPVGKESAEEFAAFLVNSGSSLNALRNSEIHKKAKWITEGVIIATTWNKWARDQQTAMEEQQRAVNDPAGDIPQVPPQQQIPQQQQVQ